MRGLACVQPLAHRAIRVKRPQARALRAREAQRPRGFLHVQAQQHRARRSRAERPARAGQMPATQPRGGRLQRKTRTNHYFITGGNRGQQFFTGDIEFFRQRQRRRYHHRTRMQLGIVIIIQFKGVR